MRTIEKTVYQFDELSDDAKEKARNWYREGDAGLCWNEEYKASIDAFIDHFGAKLVDWNIGPWSPLDYRVEFHNSNFRGMKFDAILTPTTHQRAFVLTASCGARSMLNSSGQAMLNTLSKNRSTLVLKHGEMTGNISYRTNKSTKASAPMNMNFMKMEN